MSRRRCVIACLLLFGYCLVSARAENTITLKYSYRDDAGNAACIRDLKGDPFVSLVDVARFYGIRISFMPTTGRVTLSKG